MSYWELANKIESISFRIDSIKAIIELVAEGVQDNGYSSPLWGCAEMLDVYIQKLEDLSAEAMDLHKEGKVAEEEERMLVNPDFGVIAKFKEKIKKGKK
jgi:hypothetical protein